MVLQTGRHDVQFTAFSNLAPLGLRSLTVTSGAGVSSRLVSFGIRLVGAANLRSDRHGRVGRWPRPGTVEDDLNELVSNWCSGSRQALMSMSDKSLSATDNDRKAR